MLIFILLLLPLVNLSYSGISIKTPSLVEILNTQVSAERSNDERDKRILNIISEGFFNNLSINSFDVSTQNTYHIGGTINLVADVYSQADGICKMFLQNQQSSRSINEIDQSRCMIPLIVSLRLRLAKALSELVRIFQDPPREGEIYSLLHVYENSYHEETQTSKSEESPSHNFRTACVIGIPHASSLLPILVSPSIQKVVILQPTPIDDIPVYKDRFDANAYAFVAQYFSKELYIAKSHQDISNSCSLIQIEPHISMEKWILRQLIREISYRQNNLAAMKTKCQVRVIWLSYRNCDKTQEMSSDDERYSYDDLFEWHLTSAWPLVSSMTLRDDRNGFSIKEEAFNTLDIFAVKMAFIRASSGLVSSFSFSGAASTSTSGYVIAITTTNRVLIDNALGLQAALKLAGYRQVVVLYDMTVKAYEMLLMKVGYDADRIVQIVLNPFNQILFSRNYVAFNLEQTWQPTVFNFCAYTYPLKMANSVWSVHENVTLLLQAAEYPNCRTVPLFTYERNLTIYSTESPANNEFLFFGQCSYKRADNLLKLKSIAEEGVKNQKPGLFLNFYCVTMDTSNISIVDQERDYFVHRATAVLNIHNHNSSALETHRLNYLLSMGKIVISERGSDSSLAREYEGVVRFVGSMEEMYLAMLEVCGLSEEERAREGERGRQLFERLNRNVTALKVAMEALDFTDRILSQHQDDAS
jgi:hypothetical protein